MNEIISLILKHGMMVIRGIESRAPRRAVTAAARAQR